MRVVSVLLATGGFLLLAGGVFLLPFALSPYAIQNDVYIGNYVVGPLVLVVGAVGVLGGLLGLSRSRRLRGHRTGVVARALLLAFAGGAALTIAMFLVGGRYHSVGPQAVDWPPYLNLPLLAVAPALCVVVGVIAWKWVPGHATPTDHAHAEGVHGAPR